MFYRNGSSLRFNEKLGAGNYLGSCEDSDILYRALKSSKNIVYKPEVQIYHPHYSSDTNMNEGKVKSYGLGFGAFCKFNFDFNICILFIKAEAMVVRFGTLAPLKTPIKVLTVVVQSASTLLSMDVISGSVQRARRELLYPIILSSSGMEIPAVWAYFTAPTARIVRSQNCVKFQPFFFQA